MAAAEARTAWQRMANRCFVQEDAKRAPKLACCPSSTKLRSDSCSGDAMSGWELPTSTFMHHYWNPTHSNLPADLKWWLQVQPSFGYEKDSSCKQISALEDTSEDKASESRIPSKGPHTLLDESNTVNASNRARSPVPVSAKLAKTDFENKVEGLKVVSSNAPNVYDRKSNIEHWYDGDGLMDWEAVDQLTSSKQDSSSFNLDSDWQGGEKTEPWWRIADKDELATLVAKKSLEHFDNCDLPRPQRVYIKKDPISFSHVSNDKGLSGSSGSRSTHDTTIDQVEYSTSGSSAGSVERKHLLSSFAGQSAYASEIIISENTTGTPIDFRERSYGSGGSDPSKVQLLEALCHSQTRAREAEIAAERAYNEREHIVKLFFRQASHLFAYKQWLRLLQLESLSLHLKHKDHQISSLLSDLPWVPSNGQHFGTGKWWEGKKKEKKHKCRICRYLVAFALGLGLVGAGLLLGWTLGWLLPV